VTGSGDLNIERFGITRALFLYAIVGVLTPPNKEVYLKCCSLSFLIEMILVFFDLKVSFTSSLFEKYDLPWFGIDLIEFGKWPVDGLERGLSSF
jgi:hypothetical protein